jgi:NTP pyrophosphatase (non-canonical NTP hydrolase)
MSENRTETLIQEYSDFQEATSWFAHAGEHNAPELVYLTLGLVGEAGEFADEVKKITRETGYFDKEHFDGVLCELDHEKKLLGEASDVLWYLNKILLYFGMDMKTLMVFNTYKLYTRLKERKPEEFKDLEWPFSDPKLHYDYVNELFGDKI